MSDSEILTILVLGQWYPRHPERGLLKFVREHWREYFPHLVSQSEFNRHTRRLRDTACRLALQLTLPGEHKTQVLDGVAVPLAGLKRGRQEQPLP